MPTGYTANVQNGKVTTLREYALQCARAFGALVHMRDDPSDAPIPSVVEPSDYHAKKIAEDEAALLKIESMTDEECAIEAVKKRSEELAYRIERRAENELEQARYKAMLYQVEKWTTPTADHAEFKKFMAQQLVDSMKFDDMGDYYKDDPQEMTGAEWRTQAIVSTKQSLAYHHQHNAEEIERAASKTKWLQDLAIIYLTHHDSAL